MPIPRSNAALKLTPKRPPPQLSIGEVCRLTGLRPGTLRNWEERYGLLEPARTPGGTRLYSQEDVRRVREIQDMLRRNGKSLLAVAGSLGTSPSRAARPRHDPQAGKLEHVFQLARRAKIAIETARALKRANHELTLAAEFERQRQELSSSLAEERHLDRVFDMAATAALRMLESDGVCITTFDKAWNSQVRAAAGTRFESLRGVLLPPSEDSAITEAIRTGRPLVLNDVSRLPLAAELEARRLGVTSVILAPLRYGDRQLGAVWLLNSGREFLSGGADRADIVTRKIAAAVANAMAFEEVQQSQEDAELLLDVSRHVAQLTDTDQILAVIAMRARTLLAGDFCVIGSAGQTADVMVWRSSSGTREPFTESHFRLRDDPVYSRLSASKPLFIHDLSDELRRHPGRLTQLVREGAVSALIVQLSLNGGRMGAMTVGYRSPHRLSERERRVALSIAQLAAAALDKAQLIEQARAGERRATALYKSAKALTSSLELEPMLDELCQQAAESFEATGATIHLLRDGKMSVAALYGIEPERAERIRGIRVSTSGANLVTYAVRTGETQIVLDATTDTRTDQALVALYQWHSMVMAPIKTREKVIGLLVLGHGEKNHFTPEDREMATALASQAAAAIDHAQTFAELKRRQQISGREAQVAATAASSLDLEAVLDAICRQTAAAMAAERVGIWLKDAPDILRRVAEAGIAVPNDATRTAPVEAWARYPLGRGVTLSQIEVEIRPELRDALRRFGISDSITVPFGQQGSLTGLLAISRLTAGGRFQPSDVELAEAITRQAQLAIANALAYREQQRAIQRLDELNRAKTSFLSTMRHELRTPLNAILGFSDLLHKKVAGGLTPKQDRYVNNIRQGGEQLLRLVDDILEYARMQSADELESESVGLPLLLEDVVASFGPLPEGKQLTVTIEAGPDLPPVSADPVRLGRAVRHLLDNAIKFSEPGGRVTVVAARAGRELQIRVSDQGPGIPPEDQQHIFEPFVQGDSSITRRHQGTGLGLAIVSRIVELHRGSVAVDSAPGRGSTFSIHLPLPEGDNA